MSKENKQIEISYYDMKRKFYEAEESGQHIKGYIVFTADSFDKPYNEISRTYCISSNNKAFQSGMGGYSIYGSCLDGTDPCLRMDGFMADEHGGKNGWKIERCYINSDDLIKSQHPIKARKERER